ncbi:MAG: hypothetical protein ACI81L_003498 [Verrucomicrobiales bacterium]
MIDSLSPVQATCKIADLTMSPILVLPLIVVRRL